MHTKKEIFEQANVLEKVASSFEAVIEEAFKLFERSKPSKVFFVGCGSSWCMGLGLSFQFRSIVPFVQYSACFTGSEVMLGLVDPPKDSLFVGISRSGETTETVKALEIAKKAGAKTLAVTCVEESSLARVADAHVVLPFVKEKSTVMTQSFTAMAFAMSTLARAIAGKDVTGYLRKVPELARRLLDDAKGILGGVGCFSHFAFLGYREYYATARECVIKALEMGLADAEAFHTLEYRHGPKSRITERSLVVVFAAAETAEAELKVAKELKSLGAEVLWASNIPSKGLRELSIDELDDRGEWFLKAIVGHIIGLGIALSKGLNPDTPRNLCRVVKI